MYLYTILMFLILYSGVQVYGQFSPLEVTGSGDGLNENSTYSRLPLLDDNGDISTVVTNVDEIQTGGETEANVTYSVVFATNASIDETTVNDSFTDTIVTQDTKVTVSTIASSTIDVRTTETAADTTTTSLTTSVTTETTTIADTATEDNSATTETTTTSTTIKTTKKPIKTDSAIEVAETEYKTKPRETTSKNPPTSVPVSTVSVPEDAGKRCSPVDTGLQCNVELVCYGEGEIDCTDDEEMDSDEMDLDDDMPPSMDDSDYITEGKTSEVFPIRRIGPNSQKIDFFKMFALTPKNNENNSENYEETTTTFISNFNFTTPIYEDLLDKENGEMNNTMEMGDAVHIQDAEELNSFPPPMESTEFLKMFDEAKVPSSNNNSSKRDFFDDYEAKFPEIGDKNDSMTTQSVYNSSEMTTTIEINATNETVLYQMDTNNETSTHTSELNIDITTSNISETILPENITEDNKNMHVISRTKRDKSANSSNGYHISNYKISELESSKKKLKVKLCKLSGNLVCTPRPTKAMCSGITLCQVPLQAVETVENPATRKGLEKWTIAVIVICAITATFTISLLAYLVFTSYKKLKVQPQNGVTTLTYINSAQP